MAWRGSMTALLLPILIGLTGSGCGAQDVRATLTQRPWTVAWLKDAEPAAEQLATLTFDASGRFSGTGGCNRLSGDYKFDAATSAFLIDGVASTRMLCPGPVMRYERALIAALERADALTLDREGRLVLAHERANLAILK